MGDTAEKNKPVNFADPEWDGRLQIVLIRCYASGVHVGGLVRRDGREVVLANARRLWRWHTGGAGISLSEVSLTGIDRYRSRICAVVPKITLLDALEVIPMSDEAVASVMGAAVYKP
ncbi:DUF6948 domain-containing protein [Qingshengfaniella alkalisoli]|uniref:DUF6948 domain-containing protein n=1 Tax=Qingshengfaniella alkalisoli TaxID=2599296 RepID=A0A5B8IZS5_9RHOB|nr:hypothetical protein [Qingshengfaniella alkalisoli]QDY70118.1 hypothetical protein FPZ52_11130 [Qingshengfaniella alkalisoli]